MRTKSGALSALCWLAVVLLSTFSGVDPSKAGTAELTVARTPQQVFEGFGFSFEQGANPYPTLSAEQKEQVDQLLFRDLHTRIVRLWYGPGDPEPIRDYYVEGGIVPSALENGVTELLLAPWSYAGDPDAHARTIAEDIATMRDEYGVPITATGVLNEPGTNERKRLPAEHYVPLAVAMRRELSARGLDDVTILGPEFASADRIPMQWLDAVTSEPEALDAFDALGTHSYNMAAYPELGERTLALDKQYWMTEAGYAKLDGPAEFDARSGAAASARFLNDLNNGVTHWVWFIGLGHGVGDAYQKLVMCEGLCKENRRIYQNHAYHHIRQITSSFVPGTRLYHVASDLPGHSDMTWTYGIKPPLHAAAGLRPDGRWALAVLNDTAGGKLNRTVWQPPEDYRVTYTVPQLAEVPGLAFELCRTSPEVTVQCGETVELIEGRVTLDVASLELITLVAREPAN